MLKYQPSFSSPLQALIPCGYFVQHHGLRGTIHHVPLNDISPLKMSSQKSFAESSYAVHRSAENTAPISQDGDDDRPNTPPPYSGPSTSSMSIPRPISPAAKTYPGLPKLDYRQYSPPNCILSSDQTTLKSSHPEYSKNPTVLSSLIQSLATVPPKPQIRIKGTLHGTVHFDVKLNMMNLIVPDEKRLSMNYVRLIGPGEKGWRGETKETISPNAKGGLEEWCGRFCTDPAPVRQFVLERNVINWDTSYLHGRLLSLLSNISYPGQITITFPSTHTKVVIRSPDKVNRFFSDVTSFFTGTKRFEVVKSIWPYADVERGEDGRRCAVQSEDVWFDEWKDAIRHAVLMKTIGWVTVEDRLEFLMEPKLRDGKLAEWGDV
ncbi:hypothetical protein PVAG01_08604 [Phlyctema vagabunda]|uniref:Uncharacterized protein n=1 Tax=Phlyctema vagabunda TaxID=108571 RepID=A0ABR4P9Z9_9HELO